MTRFARMVRAVTLVSGMLALMAPARSVVAQDRLPTMPGYEQWQRRPQVPAATLRAGAINAVWSEDGKTFVYSQGGAWYRYDVAAGRATATTAPAGPTSGGRGGRGGGGVERGRQATSADSPDGRLRAFYRDANLWISDASGANAVPVTTDGSVERRIKYGTASWVYGEELDQQTAMWWSPDGTRLAYYRFDESPVKDYYLQLNQTLVQDSLDVEAYPKAGTANPVVDVFVYDVASRKSTRLDVRGGQPFTDDVVGHYVYRIGWSRDGADLLLNRTNRRQNVMELTACSPSSGACRVVVREEWPASWTENSPEIRWLADGRRFVWQSERTGFANYYLYDLSGRLLSTLTRHAFEVDGIVAIDEERGDLFYHARSGDNHMKRQLHRVKLDGTGDRRLTDPTLHHRVTLSPDHRTFVDVAESHAIPPVTRVIDATDGRVIGDVARSDPRVLATAGLQPVEMFTFLAADGVTQLHGMLHKPSNFDPSRRYPVLVSVYLGPATNGASETYAAPSAVTEYGFLYVTLDARSAGGKGKRTLDAIYQKLGVVEIDDLAAGVRALHSRPYVDRTAVGVYGTSYGGYASAMAILRYPEVFAAASAMSPVTDWRHYDTIYTERYMWTPQGNAAGYDAGSAMPYANQLKGRLMLYYGTADNNVHPSNTLQLVRALQRAGKSFDLQVGPDQGHTALNSQRMMEFFIEHLVMRTRATSAAQ